jgi:hypothetical protein
MVIGLSEDPYVPWQEESEDFAFSSADDKTTGRISSEICENP